MLGEIPMHHSCAGKKEKAVNLIQFRSLVQNNRKASPRQWKDILINYNITIPNEFSEQSISRSVIHVRTL